MPDVPRRSDPGQPDQRDLSPDSGTSWTEPGAWPVAAGVHRVPLPLPMDGLRAVNVYLLEAEDGLVVLDGGWAIPEARELFVSALATLGHGLGDIRRFLVTHLHRDHYTQARVLGTELGVPVVLGSGERPSLEMLEEWGDAGGDHVDPNAQRLLRAGAESLVPGWESASRRHPPSFEEYALPDDWLEGEVQLDVGGRHLDAVPTPGHTQGHYVFVDPAASLLFAGDHVLPRITPSIGFEPRWVDQPLRDFLASLVRVRALPDLTLLPAHGPVGMSSHQRVDELVDHHDVRLDLCRRAVQVGARTAWEVAGELPWTSRGKRREELGGFDAALAAFETLAHLELLALRGELERSSQGAAARFAPLAATRTGA